MNVPNPAPQAQETTGLSVIPAAGKLTAQRALVTIGAIQVVTVAFQMVRSKITAELTGPSGVGLIGVIDQVVLFCAQLSSLSLPLAAGKFLAAAHAKSRTEYGDLCVRLFRVLITCSLAGTLIAVVLISVRPDLLGTELAGYRGLFVFALATIPLINLTALLTVALSAVHQARAAALFGLLVAVGLALASGGGLMLAGLYGYYASQLLVTLVLLAAGVFFLIRLESLPWREFSPRDLGDLRNSLPLFSLAGALCLTSFSGPLADLVARSAVLRWGGLAYLGLFQAAFGLALILRTTVRSTFSLFFMPTLNRHFDNQAKLHEAVHFMLALSRTLGILALPLVLFPDWCLLLAYSKPFVTAAPLLCLFTVAVLVQLLAAVNQNLLIGLDCTGTYLWTSLGTDLAVAALCWYLTPFLGITGVGLAYLGSHGALLAVTAAILRFRYGMAIVREAGWLPIYVIAAISIGSVATSFLELPAGPQLLVRVTLLAGLGIPLLLAKSAPGRSLTWPSRLCRSLRLVSADQLPEPQPETGQPVTAVSP